MSKISIDSLSSEIARTLTEYTKEVEEGLEKEKQKATTMGVKMLKESSPKKTGDYAAGWNSIKKGKARIIRNRTNYQLTHLLEKGHAKKGGGRVAPRVHIKPVEERVIEEYTEGVERVIKS